MLGRDVMVAPVLAAGAVSVKVYFPVANNDSQEEWIHWVTGNRYAFIVAVISSQYQLSDCVDQLLCFAVIIFIVVVLYSYVAGTLYDNVSTPIGMPAIFGRANSDFVNSTVWTELVRLGPFR